MSDREGGWILLSFMAGAVVGAAVALIMAPASGKESREKIKEVGGKAVEYIAKKAKEKLEEEEKEDKIEENKEEEE